MNGMIIIVNESKRGTRPMGDYSLTNGSKNALNVLYELKCGIKDTE